MPIVTVIVIGAVSGFVATRLMQVEAGILTTMLIGIVGALVAEALFRNVLGWYSGATGSVLGALFVIWVRQVCTRRRP